MTFLAPSSDITMHHSVEVTLESSQEFHVEDGGLEGSNFLREMKISCTWQFCSREFMYRIEPGREDDDWSLPGTGLMPVI